MIDEPSRTILHTLLSVLGISLEPVIIMIFLGQLCMELFNEVYAMYCLCNKSSRNTDVTQGCVKNISEFHNTDMKSTKCVFVKYVLFFLRLLSKSAPNFLLNDYWDHK
jgi:hypothetical protein